MSSTNKTWLNNNPPSVEDDDLNGFKLENNNLIEGSGQALNTGDRQQTNKSVAHYSSVGQFFTGAGIADAYTATVVAPRIAPPALENGMEINLIIPATSTGAGTLNAFGTGAVDYKLEGGVDDPVAGDMETGVLARFKYLTAPSAHWEIVNPIVSGFEGALLAEQIVTGSAVTSIDFTGLDINTHKSYRVEVEHINALGSTSNISAYINGDTTDTNYNSQSLTVAIGVITANRQNNARIAGTLSTSTGNYKVNVMLSNSRARLISNGMNGDSTTLRQDNRDVRKNTTDGNITQITFTGSVALSFGVGSTIRIYRGN